MNRSPIALAALLVGTATPLTAQDGAQTRLSERLDAEIPRLMESAGIPGLSAVVVLDGEIAWSGAFGIADAATGQLVTRETIFQAASLTKQVFAYTALRLADRGVFDLDQPLAEYLPNARLAGQEGYPRITARHALSHSTGLPNWGGEKLELGFDPGEGFQYSGEGYVYLQRTLEHLTGEPLDVFVDQEVLAPLGLSDSWMFWRPEFEERTAAGHNDWGVSGGVPRGREANAAWSFLTTAEDYARIVIALMDGRRLESGTFEEALEPQIQVAARSQIETTDKLYWGLGWGLQLGSAGRAIWQWGSNNGFRAYLLAFPDRRDAVVYFANGNAGLSIARDLLTAVGESAGWPDDEHWALTWLGTEPHDSPRRLASRQLVLTFRDGGVDSGLARYDELRAEHPAVVDGPFGVWVGRALSGLGETESALAVLARNAELHPRSGNARSALGDVQVAAGRYREALETFTRALEVHPRHSVATRGKAWVESAVTALDDPPSVPAAALGLYVGDYGPRHIRLEGGVLYYQRDGNPRYRLRPLSGDTFLLDGLGTFRVRFARAADGNVSKIVGLYLDGNEDETPRTP